MALKYFTYAGRAQDGSVVKGHVSAWERDQALMNLRARGITVTALDVDLKDPVSGDSHWSIGGEHLAVIYRQLSTLVDAGVPLARAFTLLASQEAVTATQRVLHGVADALGSGLSLSQAMDLFPGAFGPPHRAMVRAAEFAGILPPVLQILARFTERASALQKKVRSSTTYPIFVLLASLVTVFGLFNFIVPQFLGLVKDLKVELPLSTIVLLKVAVIARSPLTVALFVAAGFVAPRVYRRLARRAEVKLLLDRHSLRTFVLGQVTHKVAMARAMQMLAALTQAGVNLTEGLPLAGEACGNSLIACAFEDLVPRLEGGTSLADAMKGDLEVFPRSLIAYVEVGELSGDLPRMLIKAGEILSMDAHDALDTLPDLLEPLIIAVLGVMVGFILISVFVPLYSALKVV